MTAEDRKKICIECHDIQGAHRWLPQKELHFRYLACTSCHAVRAKIGMVLSLVDRANPSKPVPLEYGQLERFIETEKKGLLGSLDPDGTGMVTGSRILSFVERLRKNGIAGASLRFRILVLGPSHIFTSNNEKTRNCILCHSEDAEFYSSVVLSVPEKDGTLETIPISKDILRRPHDEYLMGDFYLLGESKIRKEDLKGLVQIAKGLGYKWIDVLGFLSIMCVMAAVCLHTALRVLTSKERKSVNNREDAPKSAVERSWHWIHGLCATFLVISGIHLRFPDVLPVCISLQNAVELHNLSGILLLVSYLFWIAYRLHRRDLTDRLPMLRRRMVVDIINILHYYWYSIFVGDRLPHEFTERTGSDPLQRLIIMILAFVLIPGQILTGILLLDVQDLMPIINKLGGLRFVDALHISFAYLLISLIIVHIYLNTLRRQL
jgi:thiosulfate reductase cytochrome b subunit